MYIYILFNSIYLILNVLYIYNIIIYYRRSNRQGSLGASLEDTCGLLLRNYH